LHWIWSSSCRCVGKLIVSANEARVAL
jgi:hypothetical protein